MNQKLILCTIILIVGINLCSALDLRVNSRVKSGKETENGMAKSKSIVSTANPSNKDLAKETHGEPRLIGLLAILLALLAAFIPIPIFAPAAAGRTGSKHPENVLQTEIYNFIAQTVENTLSGKFMEQFSQQPKFKRVKNNLM